MKKPKRVPGDNSHAQAKSQAIYINKDIKAFGGRTLAVNARKEAINNNDPITHLSLFKLYLDESSSRTVDLPPLPEGLTIIKVLADYLSKIYEHVISEMRHTLGEYLVKKEHMRFCITVPAVWTEKAKIMMREAIIMGGIVALDDPQDRVMLVSEPEAAALYCARFLKINELKHKDRFLICDAGGGTVDLITYELNDDQNGRYLIELVEGDGGICGSMHLDQRFRNLVVTYMAKHDVDFKDKELDNIVETFVNIIKVSGV